MALPLFVFIGCEKCKRVCEQRIGMKKAEHYVALRQAGLPIPLYDVFDSSCLSEGPERSRLKALVDHIASEGSGLIGVRTEPKENLSSLGNYPHYMPLRTSSEVFETIHRNESEHKGSRWWYLINEAFLDYDWNAVLRLTQDGSLPGYWVLDGEVNVTDNTPLRHALNNTSNVIPARKWTGRDAGQLRKIILKSGLTEKWLEVSKVRTPKGPRLVFWGMRGSSLERMKKQR